MSRTTYLDSVALAVGDVAYAQELASIENSAGLTSGSKTVTVTQGSTGYAVVAWTSETTFPSLADWPAASAGDPYKATLDVTAIGADLVLIATNVFGNPASFFGRTNAAASSLLESTAGSWDSTTGTGLKTYTNTSWNPAAGNTSDRAQFGVQARNNNSMKSQDITFACGTTTTYFQGPWTAGATTVPGSFTANAIMRVTRSFGDPPSPSHPFSRKDVSLPAPNSFWSGRVCYGNGFWAVGVSGTSSYNPGKLWYATDPGGTWTEKTLGYQIANVKFINGYFYAIGEQSASVIGVWRTQDPSGTWENVSPASPASVFGYDLVWNGTYYVLFGGKTALAPTIYTSTDGVNWTLNTGHGITTLLGNLSVATDGTSYVAAQTGNSTEGTLWYTTDPTGAWTENGTQTFQTYLRYADGYWVVGVYLSNAPWYRADDPTGTFTAGSNTNWSSLSGSSQASLGSGLGYWAAVDQGLDILIYNTNPLSGPWVRSGALPGLDAFGVSYAGGYWFAIGGSGSGAFILYQPGPLSANAIVRRTQAGSLTVDAFISGTTVGGSFTADAIIRRTQLGSLAIDAIKRRELLGSFTADAVIATSQTVEGSFTANAILWRSWISSITTDAVIRGQIEAALTAYAAIRRTQTGTIATDAEIVNRKFGSWTADAVFRVARSGSFKARAAIRIPGETGTHIRVNGADITDDVLFGEAQFTTLVNGAPGSFKFKVKDTDQTRSFVAGDEITLDIDGVRRFGGYLSTPSRGYFFDVDDTSVPSLVARVLTLVGWDYNILFGKRVVYDKADPKNVLLQSWPAGSQDDDVIKYIFDHYTDLADDSISYDRVEHVGSPTPDVPGVIGSGGLYFGDLMREANRLIGGVWYISPDKDLTFTDVDTPNASIALSDRPGIGEIGYREFSHVENGVKLANDAMVWGAGLGSAAMTRARTQDADSIALHGRWQYGEFTTQLYKQASVQQRADTIVYGTPQNKRGGKDDQVSWQLKTYDKSFVVGQKVTIESEVWGVNDVVPIRRMTITWPTTDRDRPLFDLTLSHEIDEPWNTFEFFYPGFPGFEEIGGIGPIPVFPIDDWPVFDGGILDDFNRQLTYSPSQPDGTPGCASSGLPWDTYWDDGSSSALISVNGNYVVTVTPTPSSRHSGHDAAIFVPLDPRHLTLTMPVQLRVDGSTYTFDPDLSNPEWRSEAYCKVRISRAQDTDFSDPMNQRGDLIDIFLDATREDMYFDHQPDQPPDYHWVETTSVGRLHLSIWPNEDEATTTLTGDLTIGGLLTVTITDTTVSVTFGNLSVSLPWTPTTLDSNLTYMQLSLETATGTFQYGSCIGTGSEAVVVGDIRVESDLTNSVAVPTCTG